MKRPGKPRHNHRERAWLYAVAGSEVAAGVIRQLQALLKDRLLEVGVLCAGADHTWYLCAHALDPTTDETRLIERLLDVMGHRTTLSLQDLIHTSPDLVLAGPIHCVLNALHGLDANAAGG